MKKILVLGATGLLGRYLMQQGAARGNVMIGTWHRRNPYNSVLQVDITNPATIEKAIKFVKPDVIIHAAGVNDVDWCEKNQESADRIIVGGACNVVTSAYKYKTRLVYISTNAVYDGENAPYDDNAVLTPVNYYGGIKRWAESQCRFAFINTPQRLCIIRSILLYGHPPPAARGNWVTKIIEGRGKKYFALATDIITQPLYALDAANMILHLVDAQATGCYNIGGGDVLSLYEFGRAVCEVMGYDKETIRPTTINDLYEKYPAMAPRPLDTHFTMDGWKAFFPKYINHTPPGVQSGLERMISENFGHNLY